jgi:type I restriction enzyme, S subunit
MKVGLPSGWAEASFGTITVNHDGTRVPVKASDRAARRGGYRYFGAQGVIDYIDDYLFDGIYLLIAEDGANLVSRTQPIAEIATGQFWVNNHAHVVESVNGISLKFLKHFMNGNSLHGAIRGTAQPKLTQADLNRLCVPVPPTAEQNRITAAIEEQFSRLDAGVAMLERVRQNIKRMRAAIFESAVTEWIGEGFPQIRLGDVLREPLRNGHSAKADPLGTIPVLTLTAVTLDDFGTHNIKMTAANPKRVRDLWIQPGDLLIERSNTRELVGTACLYRGRPNLAVYPDLVIRARVDDRVVPEYAELVLKAPRSRRYFQQRAQGISGTMPKIDQQAIEDLVFTLPSPEMQAAIVQEAERRLTLLGSLQGGLELVAKRSSSLRSSILTAAFSGQLASQDPNDEPASVLLERIAAERTAPNGHKTTRARKPRVPREEVTA